VQPTPVVRSSRSPRSSPRCTTSAAIRAPAPSTTSTRPFQGDFLRAGVPVHADAPDE